MPEDDDFTEHLRVIGQWATPSELRRILRWATPDELEAILKAAGPPEEMPSTIAGMKSVLKGAERWGWLRNALLEIAKYIMAVGPALVLLGAAAKFLGLWRP